MIRETTQTAAESAAELANRLAREADHAIDATRQSANGALDRLSVGVDHLHDAAASRLDQVASQAEDLRRRSAERARQMGSDLREQVAHAGDVAASTIRHDPLKSVIVAAATGAAVAVLVGWISRLRDQRA